MPEEYICPNCKKPIYDEDALLCHFCGESLNRSEGFLGKIKSSPVKFLFAAVVMVVILSFILMML